MPDQIGSFLDCFVAYCFCSKVFFDQCLDYLIDFDKLMKNIINYT